MQDGWQSLGTWHLVCHHAPCACACGNGRAWEHDAYRTPSAQYLAVVWSSSMQFTAPQKLAEPPEMVLERRASIGWILVPIHGQA